jgi:hypothetical protein
MKRSILLFTLLLIAITNDAQELQARVIVNTQRIPTNVDKKIFTTLQTALTTLLNNRKWTNDNFQPQEKIECQFLLNLERVVEPNVYAASLVVQAARPVYNTSYNSALLNFQDADVTFKYQEFQPVEFNENRVAGTDPLASNITAIFAYYANIILGLDYDSFSPKGGDIFFQKASNIVNNAPENRNISGWRQFDGLRNRYFLVNNLLNSKFNILHDVIYSYYRHGLDNMYEGEADARQNILQALTQLQAFNQENPNTMFLQVFMQGKNDELIKIFKKAPPADKTRALELLSTLDVANIGKYKQELK